MAYSKAKLNSDGDRASPCFKPFLIGNMSDKFAALQYISVIYFILRMALQVTLVVGPQIFAMRDKEIKSHSHSSERQIPYIENFSSSEERFMHFSQSQVINSKP